MPEMEVFYSGLYVDVCILLLHFQSKQPFIAPQTTNNIEDASGIALILSCKVIGNTVAHGTLLDVAWKPGWEGSLRENGYMCMYGWVPCCSSETITTLFVIQQYSNTK